VLYEGLLFTFVRGFPVPAVFYGLPPSRDSIFHLLVISLFHYGKLLSVTQGELIGRVFRAASSIQKEKHAALYYDLIYTPEK
jgi:hypothetical protein